MTEYPCPTCKNNTQYNTSNPFRPFCCKRCKLIDLGDWANETHRIEGKPAADTLFSEDIASLMQTKND